MNKLHVAGTGWLAGGIVEGIKLFFPHALSPDQAVWLTMAIPTAAMFVVAVVEAIWPKSKSMFDVVEHASN